MLTGQSFKMFESSDLVESDTRNLQLRARACMSLDQVHNMLKEDILSTDEASDIIRAMLISMLPKHRKDDAETPDEQPSPKRAKHAKHAKPTPSTANSNSTQ